MPLERCDEHHVNNVSHTDTFLKSSYSNSVSLDNYPYSEASSIKFTHRITFYGSSSTCLFFI